MSDFRERHRRIMTESKMRNLLLFAVLGVALVSPTLAQTSIRGVDLSPTDAARVDRQCDALRFRQPDSLASIPPEEPPAGVIVSDSSSYWAERADGIDSALANIDLDTLSVTDCRAAGFYD